MTQDVSFFPFLLLVFYWVFNREKRLTGTYLTSSIPTRLGDLELHFLMDEVFKIVTC